MKIYQNIIYLNIYPNVLLFIESILNIKIYKINHEIIQYFFNKDIFIYRFAINFYRIKLYFNNNLESVVKKLIIE